MLEKIASIVGEKTSLDKGTRSTSVTNQPKEMPATTSAPRRQQVYSPIQVFEYSLICDDFLMSNLLNVLFKTSSLPIIQLHMKYFGNQ